MARYIDADLIDLTKYKIGRSLATDWIDIEDVKRAIALTPTADVAPKSEVAREIFEEIEKIIDKHHSECYEYEDGDECDTAITYISYISYDIAELKKKYTEGKEWI